MKFRKILSTAVLAAGLSFAGAAAAYPSNVVNICEVTSDGVKTVHVQLLVSGAFVYAFQKLPSGPVYTFGAPIFSIHKFALPAGVYKFTFKHPNDPSVDVLWPHNVVVKPYQVVGGVCAFLIPNPLGKAEPARHQQQQ